MPITLQSLWQASANDTFVSSPLKGNLHSDVVIIGGGYSGLSAALHTALQENSLNVNSGFKDKDIVIAINGQSLKYHDEVETILQQNKGKEISMTVKRGSRTCVFPHRKAPD